MNINFIELKNGDEVLEFTKSKDLWFVKNQFAKDYLPAQNEKINSFLSDLSLVKDYEKISSGNNLLKTDFGLSDENAFIMSYLTDDGKYEIKFGDSDFSHTSRYFMSGKNLQVYKCNSDFDKYLSVKFSEWADPYIISRNLGTVYSESDIMNYADGNILRLRHGGASYFDDSNVSVYDRLLKIEMGDTSCFILKMLRIPDEENYHIRVEYYYPFSEKKISYCVKVSETTYNRL
ncbi:MAG: DUF4340 domain-containing protein [Clostridia bacterium]|nr:DUF4340 domain-containing protein [Clostridia bacterium]